MIYDMWICLEKHCFSTAFSNFLLATEHCYGLDIVLDTEPSKIGITLEEFTCSRDG